MSATVTNNKSVKKLSLRRNFVWTTIGTVVYAASQALAMVVVEKLAGTEALGSYAFATAVSMPIFLLTSLSLGRVMVIDANDSHAFGEYLGVRIFLNIFSFIVVALIAILKYEKSVVWVIIIVAVFQAVKMTSIVTISIFQKNECMNFHGISNILQGILFVSGLVLGIWITDTLIGGLIVLCLLGVLKLLLYDLLNALKFTIVRPIFNFSLLKEMVKKCWVISIASGVVGLSSSLPRFIAENSLGLKEVGYFAGISMFTLGMLLVVIALATSALRRLAVYFQTNVSYFITLLFKLIAVAIGFGLLNLLFTFVAGRYFLVLFFNKSYVAYIPAMYLFAVAGALLAIVAIMGDTIISTRHYWWRIISSLIGILVIYVSSIYLVPKYKLSGISLACILGFGRTSLQMKSLWLQDCYILRCRRFCLLQQHRSTRPA